MKYTAAILGVCFILIICLSAYDSVFAEQNKNTAAVNANTYDDAHRNGMGYAVQTSSNETVSENMKTSGAANYFNTNLDRQAEDYLIVKLNDTDCNTCALEYDGQRYAYIGCNISPARIVKFDLQEMKRVSSIDLPLGEDRDQCRISSLVLTSNNTVIHASYTNPCVFTRINTDTMEVTGTLAGKIESTNDKYIRSMIYDGRYVYAAVDASPGKIIKIDPVTMTRVDSRIFSEDEASCIFAITIVGDYIVGVCDRDIDEYATIFRVRKDNLHGAVESIHIKGITNYHSLCSDGRYIYAAASTNPLAVVKVDVMAANLAHAGTYIGEGNVESGNYSITYDGTNIIAGTWNLHGRDKLIKINPGNMQKAGIIDFLPSYPADLVYIKPYIYTCTDNSPGNVVRLVY